MRGAAAGLLVLVVLVGSLRGAGSRRAGVGAAGCRDRIAGCHELIDSGERSCDEDFCDDCGNQRHRCDATCGFCTGGTGASRAATTAHQLAAVASRSHAAAPPVIPPVVSCYTTKLNEATIRDHRCEGAVAGANSCFINMALRLAGCCFAPGTAPAGRRAAECNAELDGRICHSRACNTPVPVASVALPLPAAPPAELRGAVLLAPAQTPWLETTATQTIQQGIGRLPLALMALFWFQATTTRQLA
jgi:hypothetical protein